MVVFVTNSITFFKVSFSVLCTVCPFQGHSHVISNQMSYMTLREKSALQGQRVLGEPPVYRFMPKGDYARKGLCQKGTMICQKGIMPNRGCQIGRCQIGDAKRGLCQILVCQITAQPQSGTDTRKNKKNEAKNILSNPQIEDSNAEPRGVRSIVLLSV